MVTSGAADPCMAGSHAEVNMHPNIDVDDQCGVTHLLSLSCNMHFCCRGLPSSLVFGSTETWQGLCRSGNSYHLFQHKARRLQLNT